MKQSLAWYEQANRGITGEGYKHTGTDAQCGPLKLRPRLDILHKA